MKSKTSILGKLQDQQGAILVLVAILFSFVFIALLAFAIDIGHIVVVRNELQNAADAGALAGAMNLYYDKDMVYADPSLSEDLIGTVNPNANQIASDTAMANKSDKIAVEVYNPETNSDDVQRGHWNTETRTFTPSDSLENVSLVLNTTEELNAMDGSDGNPPFINAVKVRTWRGNPNADIAATPIAAFFAQIFGIDSFTSSADAIAWLGYASYIAKGDVDLPLALCVDSIEEDGTPNVDCTIGRRINSGNNEESSNTGGWTSFEQDGDKCISANKTTVASAFKCVDPNDPNNSNNYENPYIEFGHPMAAIGGQTSPVYADIIDCWKTMHGSQMWPVVVPLVICEGKNVGTCPVVVGVAEVDIVFMSGANEGSAKPDTAPFSMSKDDDDCDDCDWNYTDSLCQPYNAQVNKSMDVAVANLMDYTFQDPNTGELIPIITIYDDGDGDGIPDLVTDTRWQGESTYTAGMARWDCFTDHFNLKNADDNYAPLDPSSIYFKPGCFPKDLAGGTGGTNFGILAKRPVLVE